MNQIVWVNQNDPLPDVHDANSNDVLAVGLDLTPNRLFEAYSKGLFPWFSEGEPVLWWSPDPRMILKCADIHVSKNLTKLLRRIQKQEQDLNPVWKVTTNLAFEAVIDACSSLDEKRNATWITSTIRQVYTQWHYQGHVNSIEIWYQDKLVGGLYGVLLGRFFFGESMFSNMDNASKIALFYLTQVLKDRNIHIIDCQQETAHLKSMGATTINRRCFLDELNAALQHKTPFWNAGQIMQTGRIQS